MADTDVNTNNTGSEDGKFSILVLCEACAGPTHIERIGVQNYYVCDDVTCMWMKAVPEE